MKKQTSEVISRESLVNELKRVLNLGMDVHYRPGIEWLRGDFQNVARWEPGHRLEAYATLDCRRGCRWSADLAASAFGTSFHTPES